MADNAKRLVINDLSGGRNQIDAPTSPTFKANEVYDAVNVEYWRTKFGRKRNGSSASGVSFSAGGPFTGKISSMFRHVPGTDETAAEQWAIDDAATPVWGRKAAATTFAAPTILDAITGNAWDVTAATLNGLLFFAYKSAQSRLHVWDGSTVRRAGISPGSNAPTVADTGAGAYAATLRYYRVRWLIVSGSYVVRSEPTPSVSFTPSGGGSAARITKPATPSNEGITHWEIEISTDNTTWYRYFQYELSSHIAIGTTTGDDSQAPAATIAATTASEITGTFTLQKSYRFLAADQNRLLGFGSFTTTDKQNRVEFSGVVGSRDRGDAERVDTTSTYYLDLDENDSGEPTGLCGPVFGNFYAFKARQMWELRATGDVDRPYEKTPISKTIGCVRGRAYCIGEDAQGNAAIYWMSHRGVYRYGVAGMEYIGKGCEDYVLGPNATMNLDATKVVAHMQYYADKRQVWAWWAGTASNEVQHLFVYQVDTGGWTRYTNQNNASPSSARCSCMLPSTLGATMSRALTPYIGDNNTANTIRKCDDSSVTADDSNVYWAYVNKPIQPYPGFSADVGEAELTATSSSTATIYIHVNPSINITATTKTGSVSLAAGVAADILVTKRVANSDASGGGLYNYFIGDTLQSAAPDLNWTVHQLVIPVTRREAT